MVENDRISISGNRRTLRITHLTEADTALYSSEVLTTGGLEVTQYWLVVRGGWWSTLYILYLVTQPFFPSKNNWGWPLL